MAYRLRIPRLNDSRQDFYELSRLWTQVAQVAETNDDAEVVFDFSGCDFLRPNAVVFLGGLARLINQQVGHARLAVETMHNAVRINLEQNGFAWAMGADVQPWRGNSIPFREYFRSEDKDTIMDDYLKSNWLGRGWVNVSHALCNEIAGQMWEIYANAFEHSSTPVGVLSCGQYFPQRRELVLAVGDFGAGIPSKVRDYRDNPGLAGAEAMRWAFSAGTSTVRDSRIGRGLGLDLLKQFIKLNHGRLEVYSSDGYVLIDGSSETYDSLWTCFQGTLVNVSLQCDEKLYMLSYEDDSSPFF